MFTALLREETYVAMHYNAMNTHDFPNRIRETRLSRGLTLKQVASAANTTHQQVRRLETGERELSLSWIERLSKAMGCHPLELLPASISMSKQAHSLAILFESLSEDDQNRLYQVGIAFSESVAEPPRSKMAKK